MTIHDTTTNKILTGLNKAECGRRYTTSNINYSGQPTAQQQRAFLNLQSADINNSRKKEMLI